MPWERIQAANGMIVLTEWQRAADLISMVDQPMFARKRAQIQRGLALQLAKTDTRRATLLARDARAFYARDTSAADALAELDSVISRASR